MPTDATSKGPQVILDDAAYREVSRAVGGRELSACTRTWSGAYRTCGRPLDHGSAPGLSARSTMATPAQRLARYRHTPARTPDWAGSQYVYRPRRPTTSPLYPVVQHHLETFLAQATEADPMGYGVPWWVETRSAMPVAWCSR